MSAIEQINTLLAELSFSEKLSLNVDLSSLIKKEGKTSTKKTASKRKTSDNDEEKPKRKAAVGTLAWIAFVKHCKTTMPERFEDATLEKERLEIVKIIKAEDTTVYDAFVAKFKEEHAPPAASPSDEEEASVASETDADSIKEEVAPPTKKPVAAKKEVVAKQAPAPTPAKPVEKKAASTPVKPVQEKKAPGAPKKAAKVAKTSKPVDTEGPSRITIEEDEYFIDNETNGLWRVDEDGEGFGPWVGYYQAANKSEPIRYTDSPADE